MGKKWYFLFLCYLISLSQITINQSNFVTSLDDNHLKYDRERFIIDIYNKNDTYRGFDLNLTQIIIIVYLSMQIM